MSTESIHNAGFIGLGIMGLPMARNLMKAGFNLAVYNRTASRCQPLVHEGATLAESPGQAAAHSDVVITMVTDTPDVEEVILGENGVIHSARPGLILIDMSTISPKATRRMAGLLHEKGVYLLDAPVSGGDIGAQNGTLTIMAGGEAAAFDRCMPVLQALGKTLTHVGPSGAGQCTKLCNQVLVAIHLVAVSESLLLAKSSGLDLHKTLQVLTGGAANSWSLQNLGPKIVDGDLNPGFMVRLLLKDLRLVMEAAADGDLPMIGTSFAQQMFIAVQKLGCGSLGTQSVIRAFEQLAGISIKG
jgi:3-hydroxyisobutyrate dehydrogenase